MPDKQSVEQFCSSCGERVVMQFRRDGTVIDVEGCEPCRVTNKGTVYCECPGCGEDVALHPPHDGAAHHVAHA